MSRSPLVRAELHCHTVFSHDGHIRFDGLMRVASRRRLTLVAITDHDTIDGAMDFAAHARHRAPEVRIVVGEERTLADGRHLIGLFLREAIRATTVADAVGEIAEQGGLCVLPHPYRRDGVLAGGEGEAPAGVATEIFNPKCSFAENQAAARYVSEHPRCAGGSDAHYESDLGECVNEFPWLGDERTSVEAALFGGGPLRVLGLQQSPGDAGRRYAPLYYRLKPFVRMPRVLVPAARVVYRAVRNAGAALHHVQLEEKYVRGE